MAPPVCGPEKRKKKVLEGESVLYPISPVTKAMGRWHWRAPVCLRFYTICISLRLYCFCWWDFFDPEVNFGVGVDREVWPDFQFRFSTLPPAPLLFRMAKMGTRRISLVSVCSIFHLRESLLLQFLFRFLFDSSCSFSFASFLFLSFDFLDCLSVVRGQVSVRIELLFSYSGRKM